MRHDPMTPAGARTALETLWAIRRFEEAVEELFQRGLLHGTMHLSIGQEAVSTGACGTVADGDLITSTHRGHGHCLAHGADPERMMAELLGRDTGYCRGRGGSMHIADVSSGNLGANGIVAGSMGIAVGAAYAEQRRGSDRVVTCFFGDGATNEGGFHEAINLGAVWGVPVVFVCENNQYGMSMPASRATAGGDIAGRACAYGIPGHRVDGNDVVAVHRTVGEAVDRARGGEGPTLIEAVTYRYRGHSKSDRNLYRTTEEIEAWRSRHDPIDRYEQTARDEGLLGEDEVDAAREAARETIRRAVQGAHEAPPADPTGLEEAAYA
jgi:pyruvate dehydrogenase E1 component alpha subunit